MDIVTLLYDIFKLFFCPQQLMIFLSALVWATFIHIASLWNILLLLCLANFFFLFKSTTLQFLQEAFLSLLLSSTHSSLS